MANMCSFSMCVKGKHGNIESFYNALIQEGNVYMGSGADAEINYDDEEGKAFIDGWCKWSVESALIRNAISMRTEPDKWWFGEGFDMTKIEFVTLWEACEKWSLDMEVYSEECGCCFQEHYVYVNGDVVCDECVEHYEYCIGEFTTKKDAEDEFGIKITDEEWNSGEDFISRGGFENWDFEI